MCLFRRKATERLHHACVVNYQSSLDETSRPVDATLTRRGCLCYRHGLGVILVTWRTAPSEGPLGPCSVRRRPANHDNSGQRWSPNVSQIRSSLPGCREPSGLFPQGGGHRRRASP